MDIKEICTNNLGRSYYGEQILEVTFIAVKLCMSSKKESKTK